MASPGAQAATRRAGRPAMCRGKFMRNALAALVLATGAGGAAAAYAADAQACLKAGKPDVDAFNDCAKPKVRLRAQSNDTPDEIIDAVTRECQSHLDDLRALLHAEPCDQNDAETDQVIGSFLQGERKVMSEDIANLRGAQ